MPLITRESKGSKLTIQEMDGNLIYLDSLGVDNVEYSNIDNTVTFTTQNGSIETEVFPIQGSAQLAGDVSIYKNQYYLSYESASNIVPLTYYGNGQQESIQAVYGKSYFISGTLSKWLSGTYTEPTLISGTVYSNAGYNPTVNFSIGTGFNGNTNSIVIQPADGKIIVGGAFTTYNGQSYNRIIRLNTDGTPDGTFTIGTGFPSDVLSIALQSDGKIIVGGSFTSYNGFSQNYIFRLNSDGTRDTSFSIGTGFNATVRDVKVQSDGKILAVGDFTNFAGNVQNYIARLNSNGSRDTGWNSVGGFNNVVNKIAIQSDGKIVAAGIFSTYSGTSQNRITRILTTGARDTTFVVSTGFNGMSRSLAIQSDGKILVGGQFTTYQGVAVGLLTRLNSDGSRDTSFTNLDGRFSGNTGTRTIETLLVQADGKILVGGTFQGFFNVTQNAITRLNSDGTRDTSFVSGTGFLRANGALVTIVTQVIIFNDIIYAIGQYDSYQGGSFNNLVRISNTGKAIDKLDLVKFYSSPASGNYLTLDGDDNLRLARSTNHDKIFLDYRLIEFTESI